MLSTNYISRLLPTGIWDRFSDIEHEMIMACAGMLEDSELMRLWTVDKFRAEMWLREELNKISAKYWNRTGLDELRKAMETAAGKALEADERIYAQAYEAGLTTARPAAIGSSLALLSSIQRGYVAIERAINSAALTGTTSTVARLRQALAGVAGGEVSIDAALRSAINDLAAKGVTGHVYAGGARISLAPYVRREVSTGVMNVTRELSRIRAKEWGSDLIQVSAHAGARPGCFPYQGDVYSLSGKHPKYHALDSTSYGEPSGLFGVNCRHFHWPFFEGLNTEYTKEQRDPAKYELGLDNDEVYRMSQRQRYNERQIRAWKRRAAELEEAGLEPGRARAKVRQWQKNNRELVSEHHLQRDYLREAA